MVEILSMHGHTTGFVNHRPYNWNVSFIRCKWQTVKVLRFTSLFYTLVYTLLQKGKMELTLSHPSHAKFNWIAVWAISVGNNKHSGLECFVLNFVLNCCNSFYFFLFMPNCLWSWNKGLAIGEQVVGIFLVEKGCHSIKSVCGKCPFDSQL